jgi:ribonucleoside-triphosphate reductase
MSRYVALSYLYGYPVFQNYCTGTLHPRYLHEPETVASDIDATYLRHGGVHGNSDNQGCLSVVTLNLPRLSHLSRTEDEFFGRLDEAVEIAGAVHEGKRRHLEKKLAEGRLPETARHLESLDWHFSAVNVVGMNEALLGLIDAGAGHVAGKAVTYRLLEHLVRRIEEIQSETGHLYTLEAAPCVEAGALMAERETATRPGDVKPFYTASTELPPWHGDDLWDAMEHQKKYHGIYTGGDVFQIHLARGLNYREECKLLLRRSLKVFGFNHLKVSPVFSLCRKHGYLFGEQRKCPVCGGDAETYTWVDCSPRPLDELSERLKEAHRRRVYSDVKDR